MAGNCHLILSSCVNALNKEWAPPPASLYNRRKPPYGLYLFSYPISSFYPWKATAKHCHQFCFRSREQRGSDSPFCDQPTTDFWSPAQSLEFILKFWAVVKSSLPDPDGFDFGLLTIKFLLNKGLTEEHWSWREVGFLIHWLRAMQT